MHSRLDDSVQARHAETRLGVSLYDRVTGVLCSSLILAGVSVGLLGLMFWLGSYLHEPRTREVIVETQTGLNAPVKKSIWELEIPTETEIPEWNTPSIGEFLESVSDVAANLSASEDVEPVAVNSRRTEKVIGIPLDDTIVPRWKRWEIRYLSNHIRLYEQQLDFFRIELGALGGKPQIDYAMNFTNARPDRREGRGSDEKRLGFTWKSGNLKEFDRQLLARAGIDTEGRILMQFYSDEIENRLANVEMENAKKQGHPHVREFLHTVFGVRQAGKNFEFYVMDQRFRPAPP